MEIHAPVTGGRWRCPCCELFISHQELQLCGLTEASLVKFADKASSTRHRVLFRADKSFELLPEQELKYAKRRQSPQNASNGTRPTSEQQLPSSHNRRGGRKPDEPIEVIELD